MQRIIKELSDALGWAETIHIVRKWGGRELRVPKKVTHGDPLALVLGYATAKRLVETFGGDKLQLPSERNALLDARNQAIFEEVRNGDSQEAVGLRYGLTRQAVQHIVKKVQAATELPQTLAVKETTEPTAKSPATV